MKQIIITLAVCSVFVSVVPHAEIIFTAPPREKAEQGQQFYGPIAELLTQAIGEKVVYEHPGGWANYSRNMRQGKYDIVFDGPHFAAWRIKNLGHIPIAKLPGTLDFILITKKNDSSVRTTRDLVGKKFCGLPSPNLATMVVYGDIFPNPVLQPDVYGVRGGMKNVLTEFRNGKCQAAVLRKPVFDRLSKKDKDQFNVLVASKPLPNQTITVSNRLRGNANKIARQLTSNEGSIAAQKLLTRYSKQKKQFIATQTAEYNGIENLLEGVVWGW